MYRTKPQQSRPCYSVTGRSRDDRTLDIIYQTINQLIKEKK